MAADAESTIRIGIDTTEALASIKNLQAQISAFHTQLQSSGNAANAAVSQNLQRGLINNLNATGKFAASLTTVKSSAESFTTSLEKNKLSMGEYFRFAGASSKTFGRLFRSEFDLIEKVARERVKTINTQFIKMGRDANGAITAIKVRPLIADLDTLAGRQAIAAQKQQVLNQLLNQGSTNLLNFGKNTQWAGRQLMVGFTIPLAYLGTVAGKTFMKMEEQALRFKRVYGELFTTSDETDRMVKDIQKLASEYTKYGVAVEKTMELAADAAAMGKMGADLLSQVAEATRLAVLGNVENEQALATTISLTNAFGTATDDLAKKINFLNAVENQTVTSIEDLTIAIPKAGPVIKQLGGDVEDLAFFLTAMKEGGINASESANALKSGLASLINPTEKASEFMQGFGINLKGIVDSNKGDVKGIVIDFANALDKLDPLSRARSIEQLFGKFQFARLSTLFQNVIQEGNQASRVLKLTRNTTEELAILSERELKRVEDSTGYKFKKALEDLKSSLIPLGEQFLKIITPIAEFASKALGEFNKLSDGTKTTITTIVTLLGGVGPIALMTFGLLANGIANIIKLFSSVRNVFARFGGAVTGAGTSVSYMTQEQLEAAAVAASLNQTHSQLIQTFTLEKASIDSLTTAYNKAVAAQARFNTGAVARGPVGGRTGTKKYNSGVLSVPGPKGAGDIVPAMLAPGEAVIPAKQSKKYSGFIRDMINDNLPGYKFGRVGAKAASFAKSVNPFSTLLRNSRVSTRIPNATLQGMLKNKDFQYRNAFETGTGRDFRSMTGANSYGQSVRTKMEQDMLGIPSDAPASQRPTYGSVESTPLAGMLSRMFGIQGKQFRNITRPRNENLDLYGSVDLVGKKSLNKKANVFAGDALKNYRSSADFYSMRRRRGEEGNFLPPMVGSSRDQLEKGGRFWQLNSPFGKGVPAGGNSFISNPGSPYIEAQVAGGFSLKDIAKIRVPSRAEAKELQKQIDQAGLGIRVTPQNAPVLVKALSNMFGTRFAKGVLSVPGKKGAGDVVPAMLAPGESVIPADVAEKNRGFIASMIAGKIPGFLSGIDNVGKKDKDFINTFAQKYSNIPEISPIIQKTIDRMNSEGIRITQGSFRAELKKDSGRLFELANTTARVSPTTGDSSAMTGLNATHGNAPINVTPDMARSLAGQVGEDSGFGRRLMESAATGKNSSAMSNLTFGMPAGFNRQEALMSGTDSADFVKKFPKLFMEPITAMYSRTISGLSADKLGVNQFAEIVSKRLATVGKKAVTEKMFYDIVKESMAEMKKLSPSSPALKALEKARNEFRVIQYGGGGGRRGELTKGLSFNANGQVVAASGAPNYRGDASRAAIAGGTSVADSFTEKLLARALKAGTYLPNVEETPTTRAQKAKAAVANKTTAKAATNPKGTKSGATKSKNIAAKRFPGGFDINRVITKIDSRSIRYSYLDENGRKVPLKKVDLAGLIGADVKEYAAAEKRQLALLNQAPVDQAPETAAKRTNRFGKAAGIGALALGGAGVAATMLPQGDAQAQGGVDLVTGAIIASTVASIPSMFGKTLQDVFKPVVSAFGKFTLVGKIITVLGLALAAATPLIMKAFTPAKDTEGFIKGFNGALGNNASTLEKIAKTFGRVSSADVFSRRRQDAFSPLAIQPGQTPFGDSFVAAEEGKKIIEQYQKALSESGPKAAVSKLAQQLSYSVVSGVFSATEARSIAMSIGRELEDLSIGVNVSAKISDLLGPNGEKLKENSVETLLNFIGQSGSALEGIFAGISEEQLSRREKIRSRGPGRPSVGAVNLSDADTGVLVGTTVSLLEGASQSLATFELIYDEQEAIVQKELDYARAIKDSKKESEAMSRLSEVQNKRLEGRARLQKSISDQLKITEEIFAMSSFQGQTDILSGFEGEITKLYKDTPFAKAAEDLNKELKELRGQAFAVTLAASVVSGDISADSLNTLIKGLDGTVQEIGILANVSSVIKNQGGLAGKDLVNILNNIDREDLQLRLSAFVVQDQSYLDFFSTLASMPDGAQQIEFFLDPKNRVELSALMNDLKELEDLAKNGDFDMKKLLTLDLDIDEAAFDTLKENSEYFNKLPANQKKTFTTTFLSVLSTISDEQIDAEMASRVQAAVGDEANPLAADRIAENKRQKLNTSEGRDKIAAELAMASAKRLQEIRNMMGLDGSPTTPATTGPAKPQVNFLDSIVRKIRDMAKSTQKLTQGWNASAKAVTDFYKELASGEADDQRGLSQRLRAAGVDESLIPGLLDLKATNPEEFGKLFIKGISGGFSELGEATNRVAILTNAIDSFGEAQSKAARQSRQQTTAISRLMSEGVSYSDALEMVQDESLRAMAASGGFNDELRDQIALFRDAKAAAASSAQGMADEFQTAFDLAMQRFSAEEAKIDIALQIKIADDEALIADLQEKIALINDNNDDLDYGLGLIAEQEESINKEYDDRIEALDEVENANRRIASLQQKQISLAQAISEGDVFAAAKAMQDLESANAEAFTVDARDMLDREKVAKLEQATAEVMVDGQKKKLTRLEIEQMIKENLKQIAKIEESQLEPAEQRVRKATALAEASKSALEIAGFTKLEWEKVGNEIDLARLDVIAYDGMLETALGKVNAIVAAWKEVAKEQRIATANSSNPTDPTKTVSGRSRDVIMSDLNSLSKKILAAEEYLSRMNAAGKKAEAASATKTLNDYLSTKNKLISEYNSAPKLASGGFVSGKGTATSDSIPAMLSNGEYVINARTANTIGVDMLDAINFGKVPGFAKGGPVNTNNLAGILAASKKPPKVTPNAMEIWSNSQEVAKPTTAKKSVIENVASFVKSIISPSIANSAAAKGQDSSSVGKFLNEFSGPDSNITLASSGPKKGIASPTPKKIVPASVLGSSAVATAANGGNSPMLKDFTNFLLGESIAGAMRGDNKLSDITASDAAMLALSFVPGSVMAKGASLMKGTKLIPAISKANPIKKAVDFVNKKLDIIKTTKNMVTRSINPNLATSLLDPANVKPMQGRSLGPGMYFSPSKEVSEKVWGGLGGNVYTPKIGPSAAIKLLRSKGYATADDVRNLGVRIDKGDSVLSPSIKKLQEAGYIGYKGSNGLEMTNWLMGAKNGLKLKKYGMGGMVKPQYFNYGGMVKAYAKGGDVVPSMLTPGEFVMSKYAVQNYGVDKMKSMNNGTYNGDSVYNYNLSVNVKSDANPDDIARTVMTQIRQVESQRIRSAR